MQDVALGIVIVSYNTAGLLQDCLASLQGCTLSLRIVVVDNNSSDESVDVVRRDFPHLLLIANEENVGYARANNQGLRALGLTSSASPAHPAATPLSLSHSSAANALEEKPGSEAQVRAPYLLLLNPDTVVQEGALETLVRFMEDHPRVGAAGPRLLNPDGSIQENAFTFPTLWMSFFDFFPIHGRLYYSRLNGRYRQTFADEATPFPIDHPLGACLLLRRGALEEVGLLDEAYYIYVEEVDLCYRLKRAGWEIYHVPASRVVHYGGQSTRQRANRMFVELHRSRYRFFRKFRSPAFRWSHRRIIRLGLASRARRDRNAFRRGQISEEILADRLATYREVAEMR